MKEANDILSVLTHVATLLAFLVFIVPGYISLRTYDACRGGEGRKVNEAIIDVVVYSFATDIVWFPILSVLVRIEPPTAQIFYVVAASLLAFIGTPIALGWGWYRFQSRLAKVGLLSDPTAKPWDKMFARIRTRNLVIGLIITLPDGRKLGGKYVDPGFASHYPADEQVHVGETWVMNQETGAFVERVKGSQGFIIDKRDILTIEFVDWSTVPVVVEKG
jgi:Family of unknown function (DUF6338)